MPFVPRPDVADAAKSALSQHEIPTIPLEEACRGCEHLESDGTEQYPKGFDVDLDSEMLGSFNGFHRQVLCSTGKSDWIREVTEDENSLPGLLKTAYEAAHSPAIDQLAQKLDKTSLESTDKSESIYKGIYPSSVNFATETTENDPPPKLSILTSSFFSSSSEPDTHSVIVLPDYKIVHGVGETKEAARELVEIYLRAEVGRAGISPENSQLRSWPLPYSAVVLLCSHKKRDKRCHIAAPLLLNQFHRHLDLHAIQVDERGDNLSEGDAIEDWPKGSRDERLQQDLKEISSLPSESQTVGIFKVSHIGGHRYAGNVIICFPNGTSVWYGRVTPAHVGAIVESTILQGKVIPELLRGGLGLAGKSKCKKGILGW